MGEILAMFAQLCGRNFGEFLVFIYKNKGVPKIACNNRAFG